MSVRDIIKMPDPVLRKKAQPLERVDDEVRQLAADMLETMYDAPGIGLAAPQVAVARRLIVIDIARDEEEKNPVVMINPEIVSLGDEPRVHEEGCLSIPDIYAEIERPAQCRVRYIDEDGATQEMDCKGLMSTVVQHEIDHLDGVLFIDHLSRLRRDRLVKKFIKAQRSSETV
ncbi:peptide deformylase [Dichotomicrobium thermohalophilum]|uniref:Peptide deformylase n=1 Tax=Dichotomicrobium thermohalophilum TaxID=933063 RepID=A0A397QFG7_9HYPH|nr:peptide deformylase [Dichotomicrobium thermohalophilum]RIA56794.1 peptide deformylase [Dichotomicrobium thermohalophilum]